MQLRTQDRALGQFLREASLPITLGNQEINLGKRENFQQDESRRQSELSCPSHILLIVELS
ncbi:MAG: hypothetical protein ABI557_13675 [Aureliella sp.]